MSLGSKLEQRILINLLKQARKDAGLSQIELAVLLNRPQSFVSKYEIGERRIDILELRRICVSLGIDLMVFVTRLEEDLGELRETK